ncbi:MAG: hypothetical protein U0946_05395 [Patescibacteria group bacterium]|nr:hypothetical protein [Patescibacteria group bacterium]
MNALKKLKQQWLLLSKKQKAALLFLLFFLIILPITLSLALNEVRTRSKTSTTANGRFGVAIGTWNYNRIICYGLEGATIPCINSPYQMYRKNFSDLNFTSYDSLKQKLSPSSFNLSSWQSFDPGANTQFIFFKYLGTNAPIIVPSNTNFTYGTTYPTGSPMTDEELTSPPGTGPGNGIVGAEIYATSGMPGSIKVYLSKEKQTNVNNRTSQWRIRLPGITYKNNYPYCVDCIYNKSQFFQNLNNNLNFNDGNGNWYAFYILSEVEYGTRSHYLEPYEYGAVVNSFIKEVKTNFPKARFILASPAGKNAVYQQYFTQLWNTYLTPTSKAAINFTSLDLFLPAPPNPDLTTNGISAVTDSQLNTIANQFVSDASAVGNFFYNLTGKYTLLTQTGVMHKTPLNRVLNSLAFGDSNCNWCTNNADAYQTIEYGMARLVQLAFSQLATKTSLTKVQAWAYWGGVEQEYWTDPLINKVWGGLNHGIYWLTWPFKCTSQPYYGYTCPVATNAPWPTRVGMIYLKLAQGNYNYVPNGAPVWWPAP